MPRSPLEALRRGLTRGAKAPEAPFDLSTLSDADRRIVERALPRTMTGVARLQALIDAVRYCAKRGVPGAIVECGVWRGGSMIAALLTLKELGDDGREAYLFDTFEGMTAPTEEDVSDLDPPALQTWRDAARHSERPWATMFSSEVFDEGDVRAAVLATGYPEERVHFVRGPVEETLPERAPGEIALLRLDTDWYQSTRHELEHLYPRLSDGGVLIVDDYGHWAGARQAVDEYFADAAPPLLLNRVDYTCRMAIKH